MADKDSPAAARTLPVGFLYSVDAQKGLQLRAEESAEVLRERAAKDQAFEKRLIDLLRKSQNRRAIRIGGKSRRARGKSATAATPDQELDRLLEAALGSRA